MSVERVSTADYTIPSIRSTAATTAAVKTKSSQNFRHLQQQPPSQNSEGSVTAAAAGTEDENGSIQKREKKSDAQSSSKNLSKSQPITKLPGSSTSVKKQQKITAASKDKLKTAEHIQQSSAKPPQQAQSQPSQNVTSNQQQQQPLPQTLNQEQLQMDPTQKSASSQPPVAPLQQQQQKPKNSVSSPSPLSPSTKRSSKKNENTKSGSYMKVDGEYKRGTTTLTSRSKSNTTREMASCNTAISEGSNKPPQLTKNGIEWDEKKIVTKVNLNSKKVPQISNCLNIRWILLFWGFLLCSYDATMLVTTFFKDVVFLQHTYHYVFVLTFPSGPALFYLMISEKVSTFFWKTHISCQIFRVLMNIYLFLDYYCAWLDSLDALRKYQPIKTEDGSNQTKWIHKVPDPKVEHHIRTYFAVFLSLLGVVTVLTIIMFGFAINLYYYEKEALKRRREKWRRRINKILESHQTFIPPETEQPSSSEVASSAKFSYYSKK